MKNSTSHSVEQSYRRYYGKLFAALFRQFGPDHVSAIEDAIQNAFYKSLRSWKPDRLPTNKEGWLYIVARNDLLNQLKSSRPMALSGDFKADEGADDIAEDLRLKTILFVSKARGVSTKAKMLFVLKHIFGLHVREISSCTLLSEEAIYKSIKRSEGKLTAIATAETFDRTLMHIGPDELAIVEELLYAVFNIGYDSFDEKVQEIVNEDLCLEALALAKMLSQNYNAPNTFHLLALFCWHLARVPAKVVGDQLIPFFEQDRRKWDKNLIGLGLYYMHQPEVLNKYYLEALIVSKHMHMTTKEHDVKHWEEIVKLYETLLTIANSPITRLNLCYSLSKAGRMEDARALLAKLEGQLPKDHVYFSLVKAKLLPSNDKEAFEQLITRVLPKVKQQLRREHILHNIKPHQN